ncbi:MAG TPA: ribulose-phosphate 3-epimerase [Acidimicrobiia bacterium]
MRRVQIAPSLLAADFSRLGAELALIEPFADLLHLDVMDGHFVPNLSFGMPVISSLRSHISLPFDCHLMTNNPLALMEPLRESGADLITVHIEAVPNPVDAAGLAGELGLRFGLVVSPATPVESVEPFLELCDLLLVMSVVPGFGGQAFMPEALPKLEKVATWVDSRGLAVDIEVDGGINPQTAALARAAGANVFVAGTTVFGAPDPVVAIKELRAAVEP